MIEIDYPGSQNYSQFSYDGFWRNTKIVETTSGSVTSTMQFVCCGNSRCEVRDSGGTTLLAQYFSSGQTISGSNYYYDLDDLDSIREMTNGLGTIVWQQSFNPYGVPATIVSTIPAGLGFTGMFVHSRSGLNLTKYRQYLPLLGRWLSRDPEGEEGEDADEDGGAELSNLYVYADNDPIDWTDPLGLKTKKKKKKKKAPTQCLIKPKPKPPAPPKPTDAPCNRCLDGTPKKDPDTGKAMPSDPAGANYQGYGNLF